MTEDTKTPPAEGSKPANVAPATSIAPSGAPEQVTEFDMDHPAVDKDPRAGTTQDQNRIDFNDPTLSGSEAVERNLAAQGGTSSGDVKSRPQGGPVTKPAV